MFNKPKLGFYSPPTSNTFMPPSETVQKEPKFM